MRTALSRFFQRRPSRLYIALQLSLLCHVLLLSITLGGQTFGMPGLNFPWKEKRLGANDLSISIAQPLPRAPAPAPVPAPEDTSPPEVAKADKTIVASTVAPMAMPTAAGKPAEAAAALIPPPAPVPTPAATPAPPPQPAMTARMRPDVDLPIAPDAPQVRSRANDVEQDIPTQGSEEPVPVPVNADDSARKQIEQAARERALEQARLEQEKQNAERLRQVELIADAQREAARQEQLRQDAARAEQAARSEAARMEGERQELARQEGLRGEALRQERAKQAEKAQQEAARQELERAEAARREAARQEQARQAQLEAARQDAAKQEAAKQDVARQEAARQDAAKREAARQEAAKQEAARQERSKQELAQRERAEEEAKREERLRAIGKQLNEEAARRDPALNSPSKTLLPTVSSLRRGWLMGRADPNGDLVLYAEAMSQKIEMNMTFDMVRDLVKQPHARPVVTLAIRADGSVEKVTFEVSSGVPAIDEAIRKVVASQAPYAAFSPALARKYDVIEIRRTWVFDTAIRLQ